MSNKLKGKIAIITGASAGIGQACARAVITNISQDSGAAFWLYRGPEKGYHTDG